MDNMGRHNPRVGKLPPASQGGQIYTDNTSATDLKAGGDNRVRTEQSIYQINNPNVKLPMKNIDRTTDGL